MKIEIFLGRQSVKEVRYCRGISAPLKVNGKLKWLVINAKYFALWFYF